MDIHFLGFNNKIFKVLSVQYDLFQLREIFWDLGCFQLKDHLSSGYNIFHIRVFDQFNRSGICMKIVLQRSPQLHVFNVWFSTTNTLQIEVQNFNKDKMHKQTIFYNLVKWNYQISYWCYGITNVCFFWIS